MESCSYSLYQAFHQEDCPQACDKGWLYWDGTDWTNDPYFDIQFGTISIFFKLLHMSVLAKDAKYENSLTYSF